GPAVRKRVVRLIAGDHAQYIGRPEGRAQRDRDVRDRVRAVQVRQHRRGAGTADHEMPVLGGDKDIVRADDGAEMCLKAWMLHSRSADIGSLVHRRQYLPGATTRSRPIYALEDK